MILGLRIGEWDWGLGDSAQGLVLEIRIVYLDWGLRMGGFEMGDCD